jgi:hypothetical protein
MFLSCGASLAAQGPPRPTLPNTLELKDIEIVLVRDTGGGCPGRCVHYRVTIQGDGTVTYQDLAEPPVPAQTRKVPIDDVVALVNQFVGARFFEAPDRYVGKSFYARQGDRLLLRGTAGADGPVWHLNLRLGGAMKSVHLYLDSPAYLRELRDHVDQIGGPQAWAGR